MVIHKLSFRAKEARIYTGDSHSKFESVFAAAALAVLAPHFRAEANVIYKLSPAEITLLSADYIRTEQDVSARIPRETHTRTSQVAPDVHGGWRRAERAAFLASLATNRSATGQSIDSRRSSSRRCRLLARLR